jgi:lysophospholipase L1-like esterase
MSTLSRFPLIAVAAFTTVIAMINPANAAGGTAQKPVCIASGATLDVVLTRTRDRLMNGRPLTIVAIGSSSTFGAGASSPAASYPSRLEVLLRERFRGIPIRVVNRGVGGEEEKDMLARFTRDVMAEKPDLVLWQVGANAVVRGRSLATEEALIRQGVERLKAAGIEVVLIDVQYTPVVIEKPGAVPMVELIAAAARRHEIGVFRRFEMMKGWRENVGLPFEVFSVPDGLHMNDWGYDCFARNLAAAIIDSAAPPVMASAPAPSAR